jgi:hypothetical protein
MEEKIPLCDCRSSYEPGPFYTHLGVARSFALLRSMLEHRFGVADNELKIVKAVHIKKGKNKDAGCPKANIIVRRSKAEKFLVLAKNRKGHKCENKWIVIVIVHWEGISLKISNQAYETLSEPLGTYGIPTPRECESNQNSDCVCSVGGASISFGCSWTCYTCGCKWGLSSLNKKIEKFKIMKGAPKQIQSDIEETLQNIATLVSPLLFSVAPDTYRNMVSFETVAGDCRIGRPMCGKPFSGVTVVSDFSAHPHCDKNNMNGGCTAVVTLIKPEHRGRSLIADDEQFHLLHNYGIEGNIESGLGIALSHGSVIFECSKKEVHATTALVQPNRCRPTRIGLVYYQHKLLNEPCHGYKEWRKKTKTQFNCEVESLKEQLSHEHQLKKEIAEELDLSKMTNNTLQSQLQKSDTISR